MQWPSDERLRSINRILLVACILINVYTALGPLWPQASYLIDTRVTQPVKLQPRERSQLAKLDRNTNRLIIPRLQLNEPILEGNTASVLNNGLWHRPNSSTPAQGSNTVIAGHRYTYQGETAFYRLDKLRIADDIVLIYNQRVYRYRVTTQQVVSPSAVRIESASTEPMLTLYTCTPLWTFSDRLVYQARLEEVL